VKARPLADSAGNRPSVAVPPAIGGCPVTAIVDDTEPQAGGVHRSNLVNPGDPAALMEAISRQRKQLLDRLRRRDPHLNVPAGIQEADWPRQ
jgi:hypothetical protein